MSDFASRGTEYANAVYGLYCASPLCPFPQRWHSVWLRTDIEMLNSCNPRGCFGTNIRLIILIFDHCLDVVRFFVKHVSSIIDNHNSRTVHIRILNISDTWTSKCFFLFDLRLVWQSALLSSHHYKYLYVSQPHHCPFYLLVLHSPSGFVVPPVAQKTFFHYLWTLFHLWRYFPNHLPSHQYDKAIVSICSLLLDYSDKRKSCPSMLRPHRRNVQPYISRPHELYLISGTVTEAWCYDVHFLIIPGIIIRFLFSCQ